MDIRLMEQVFGAEQAQQQLAYYQEQPENRSLRYKVGAISGKFRLLHKGHKELLERAIGLCERLHVFICDSPEYRRYASVSDVQQVFGKLFMKYEFKNFEIHVVDGLEPGCAWDQVLLEHGPDLQVIFNSKEDYENFLLPNAYLQLFTGAEVSTRNIEDDLYGFSNAQLIIPEFFPYMNKKVVVTGIESCGKTMLAKKLADVFETNFSEEYGRYHSAMYMGLQEATYAPKDFVHIVLKQIIQDKEKNLEASRLLVVDTDPIVTLYYLELYREDIMHFVDEQEYAHAYESIERMIAEYKADLWIYLEPKTPFVADGLRWNEAEEVRMALNQRLKAMYRKYGFADKMVCVEASGYDARFADSVAVIEDNLGIRVC